MIQISPSAAQEINRLSRKQQASPMFRLSVAAGGCSDWLYTLKFDQVVHPDDQVFHCDDLQVIVAQQTLPFVQGTKIDYSEDLMGGGFRFHNPNAAQHCGCGSSFSLSEEAVHQPSLLE
jgi:iron-sulfur cluster assembly accessory protein